MRTPDRKTLLRVAQASGVALVAVLVVAAFVATQAPKSEPVGPAPPITLPAMTVATPEVDEQTPTEELEEEVDPEEETEEAVIAKTVRPAPPPAAKPAPQKAAAKPRPKVSAPPPKMAEATFVTQPYDDAALRVKFRSVDDLAALVDDAHVEVLLEYPDGTRFILPKDMNMAHVTVKVPDASFFGWVGEGRVSELIPTPELMDRLELHQEQLRFLAVMDDRLKHSVEAEALKASVNAQRSVLLIEEGPKVSVLLARR